MKSFKVKKPFLEFITGEVITFDSEWDEWTRKSTGLVYGTRSSIEEGEKVMLLNYLMNAELTTILEVFNNGLDNK